MSRGGAKNELHAKKTITNDTYCHQNTQEELKLSLKSITTAISRLMTNMTTSLQKYQSAEFDKACVPDFVPQARIVPQDFHLSEFEREGVGTGFHLHARIRFYYIGISDSDLFVPEELRGRYRALAHPRPRMAHSLAGRRAAQLTASCYGQRTSRGLSAYCTVLPLLVPMRRRHCGTPEHRNPS